MRILLQHIVSASFSLVLAGCALPQRGAISGTQVDFSQYLTARIGVLPITVNPQYTTDGLGEVRIQEAVKRALSTSLYLHPVEDLGQLPAEAVRFPMTPMSLSALSNQLGLDGLVGISVSSWSSESHRASEGLDEARVDLMVSYAGKQSPLSYWTVTGTWSASSAGRLGFEIEHGLPFLLGDLKGALESRPIRSLFSERQKNEPQLTYLTPQIEGALGKTDYAQKFIDLQVTSVEDSGLVEISVTNQASDFRWKLEGAKNDKGQSPIFLASKVRVPLANGDNRIVLTSVSTDASRNIARREVNVTTTARHEMFAIAIGVDRYLHTASVNGASEAAADLSDAASTQSRRPFPKVSEDSTALEQVNGLLSDAAAKLSVGDSVVISFAGRAMLLGSSMFLAFGDVNPDANARSGSLLRVEDLVRSVATPERIILLDVCANAEEIPLVRRFLLSSIPADQSALVRLSNCSEPVGEIARAAAQVIRQKDIRSYDRYRGQAFFQDLQSALQAREAAAAKPSKRTDIVFFGDDRPPKVATTDGESSQKSSQFWSWVPFVGTTKPSVAEDPFEFYVVTFSTNNQNDAIRRANELRKLGSSANVVLGTSGMYSVAVGHAKDIEGAFGELQKAVSAGSASFDAYVLPRTRISRVVD